MRTGDASGLRPVFDHNALDILLLVTLLAHLGEVCSAVHRKAEDYLALGRWDQQEGRHDDAVAMFEAALRAAGMPDVRSSARLALARLHKRLGRFEEAIELWHQETGNGTRQGKAEALVELARASEHQVRDFAAAETLTRRALKLGEVATINGSSAPASPQVGRDALEHRLARVVRRRTRINQH